MSSKSKPAIWMAIIPVFIGGSIGLRALADSRPILAYVGGGLLIAAVLSYFIFRAVKKG